MKIIVTIELDETGAKEPEVKYEVAPTKKNDIPAYSEYARFFDEACPNWVPDAEANLMFLKCQQNHANDLLKVRGHVLLNDVYDMLGLPRTKAGAVVGWIFDKENSEGDNFIDFGIFNENNRDFINGWKRSILLDFNVDGNILEKLEGA